MLVGVILAGGKSSRMGTDKSLLTLPDSHQTLLTHCKTELSVLCGGNLVVSGAQHKNGIADLIPYCGPLSGIHAAISHLLQNKKHISELLVVAVDMPDVGFKEYEGLLNSGRETNKLTVYENCFLPLYIPNINDVANYVSSVFESSANQSQNLVNKPAKQLSKQSQYSIKRMLSVLQSNQIQGLENIRLNNINTPTQWQQHCNEQPINKA